MCEDKDFAPGSELPTVRELSSWINTRRAKDHSFGWEDASATVVNIKRRNMVGGRAGCGAGQLWSFTPEVRPTTSVGC
jgi:hypothetical protein